MQTTSKEPFNANTSLEENQNNSKLNSENYNERIEGTPLYLNKTAQETWVLTLGQYKIKEGNTKEELKEYLNSNMLNVIVDMISIIVEFHNNQKTKTNE